MSDTRFRGTEAMLVLLTILLLIAIWGIIKPFKGLSRKQFSLAAAGIFAVCLLITPTPNNSGTKLAESKTSAPTQTETIDVSSASEGLKADRKEPTRPEPEAEDTSEDNLLISDEVESLTSSQNNAVRSANQYLSMTGFSRDGLIQQLSSDAGDGYSVSDATAAVDSLNADWNENAARSAKQYLEMTGFSCKGLIEQLSSSAGSDYTVEQATYGAREAGAC